MRGGRGSVLPWLPPPTRRWGETIMALPVERCVLNSTPIHDTSRSAALLSPFLLPPTPPPRRARLGPPPLPPPSSPLLLPLCGDCTTSSPSHLSPRSPLGGEGSPLPRAPPPGEVGDSEARRVPASPRQSPPPWQHWAWAPAWQGPLRRRPLVPGPS